MAFLGFQQPNNKKGDCKPLATVLEPFAAQAALGVKVMRDRWPWVSLYIIDFSGNVPRYAVDSV